VTQSYEPTPSPEPPRQPRSEGGLPWIRTLLLTVIVAAFIVGGFGVWYIFLRPAGPPPVGTGAPNIPGVGTPAPSAGATTTPTVTATEEPAGTGLPAGALDGTWSVDRSIGSFDYGTGDFSGSWVGYRVQEELVNVGGGEAVGRTPQVTGSVTIDGSAITQARFEADLTTLESDQSLRDGQLGSQGIQTDRFPTATFVLTQPIDLGELPAVGEDIEIDATGDLTIHGVTREVTIPLHAALHEGVIAAAGSLTFAWQDFDMERPSAQRVISLADEVTMETQLFFSKEG
jgi:polyisoprenoid-binding protein YceI